MDEYSSHLNKLAFEIHLLNANWWKDIETGEPLQKKVGELLMLVTSELAEAMEGDRKNLNDDHLENRLMFEVELADAIIRILDISAGFSLDIGGALVEKLEYNKIRADHRTESRLLANGKKY